MTTKATKKKRTNRIKAVFWTEDGNRHDIDADSFHKDHHLAIYKLLVGRFTRERLNRIIAILDE